MNKRKTYGVLSILGKPCQQKLKKIPQHIQRFVDLESCYYFVKGNCIAKFKEGKLVPQDSIFIVNPILDAEGSNPIVSLKELSHYVKLPAGDVRDFLSNAKPLNSSQFYSIQYYHDLLNKCNQLLFEVCPNIIPTGHSGYRFQVAAPTYLDRGFILTTKIIYVALKMIKVCRLPVCIVRDIINKWNFTDNFDIIKTSDSNEIDSYLTDIIEVDLDLNKMGQQTISILGQYRIGTDYTKISKTKVNTPVVANRTCRVKSAVNGGGVSNMHGVIDYDNAYLVATLTELRTSYQNLNLIVPTSDSLLYYQRPSSALDVAKIIMELIYSLQVKASYFSIVEV